MKPNLGGKGQMIRKTALGILIAPAALAVAAWVPPAVAATTLKVSTCLVKNDDQADVFLKLFFEPVNAAKAGVTLKYIGGPEAIPRRKQHIALKRKVVDIIFCPAAYYGGLVSEARTAGASNISPQDLRKSGAYDILQKSWKKGINARILG